MMLSRPGSTNPDCAEAGLTPKPSNAVDARRQNQTRERQLDDVCIFRTRGCIALSVCSAPASCRTPHGGP